MAELSGYGVIPVVPTGVVIRLIGDDVRLDWQSDANCRYGVFSDIDPDGLFSNNEGTTADTFFTVVDGAVGDRRFYVVRGTTAP